MKRVHHGCGGSDHQNQCCGNDNLPPPTKRRDKELGRELLITLVRCAFRRGGLNPPRPCIRFGMWVSVSFFGCRFRCHNLEPTKQRFGKQSVGRRGRRYASERFLSTSSLKSRGSVSRTSRFKYKVSRPNIRAASGIMIQPDTSWLNWRADSPE